MRVTAFLLSVHPLHTIEYSIISKKSRKSRPFFPACDQHGRNIDLDIMHRDSIVTHTTQGVNIIMLFRIAVFLTSVLIVATPVSALIFEDFGNSLEKWTFLDYSGEIKAETTVDHSCPPGYGPTVLHLEGNVVVGLAQGPALHEGTFVALYKENSPADQDADGVIMVWAQYGEDTSVEHNAKIKRPHVWLEQDNDLGFQFRVIDVKGDEYPIGERTGLGLVTGPWNRTNWIWQKVQVQGDRIRAKFWPAEQPEPDMWPLETTYDAKGNRFGLRINSGSIHVAYFAADTEDIHPQTAPAYLFSPLQRITDADHIVLTLFTNAAQTGRRQFEMVISADNMEIDRATFPLDIPAEHKEHSFLLSTDASTKDNSYTVIPLSQALPPGLCRVVLSNPDGLHSTERSFEVISTTGYRQRFDQAEELINRLEEALSEFDGNPEQAAALSVLKDVARAHLNRATSLFEGGKIDEAELCFRFVMEALSELRGYKGAWLKDSRVALDLTFLPERFEDTRGIAKPERDVSDFYSTDYQILFGQAKSSTQSMVMGQTYEIVIPWSMEGGKIDRDFGFEARLVSPLENRVVAQSKIRPKIPTSQWIPGNVYEQRVTLDILAEDAVNRPAEPVVLDEYHRLLVTVTDPETGAHLLLGNHPGDQNERVGSSFLVGRFYVSSTPLEIKEFNFEESTVLDKQPVRDSFHLRNVGDDDLTVDAVLTVSTESKRILFQGIQHVSLPKGSEKPVEYIWNTTTAGNLTISLQIMSRGVILTEASREIAARLPDAETPRVEKHNHVEKRENRFVTPLTVHLGSRPKSPVKVRVYADNRLVGETIEKAPTITLDAEPWFGYYDILVDFGTRAYEERVVATVVETSEGALLVNGEPFIVKGVNVHGLDAGSPARTELMMSIMRDLGFNTWRGDYPARWQMELAYKLNSVYTVLAPFSCIHTPEIFGRQAGPPLGTARELTRLFIERYKDSAGVLLWNSCNEVVGENIDFLISIYPLYKAYDPYQRPVHYANLYGQDLWQGQDAMGVNYYFGEGQSGIDRQPLIQQSVDLAAAHGMPALFCEYNSYYGAIHSTGVEAMEDIFEWAVEKAGIAGGFLYMRPNSTSHPGVMDGGFNTHKIFNEAIMKSFADAEMTVTDVSQTGIHLRIRNKRRCTLRQMKIAIAVCGVDLAPIELDDLQPEKQIEITVPIPPDVPGPDWIIQGNLEFVTHHGFQNKVPVNLTARH
ncbi:MAG: glycoside hydrolase family 2 TIM barrel-domain containing protein [bacterium]